MKDGALVGQIDFARRAPSAGAPRRWWLIPSKAIKRPERWWQHRDGSLCPTCQRRAAQAQRLHNERKREARERQAAVRRQQAEQRSAADLAREPEMLEIARPSLAAFAIDPLWAAEQGVIVRHCEHCLGLNGYIRTDNLDSIPTHAASALVASHEDIHCRCMPCGHPGSNNHDRFQTLGADLAGYEVRPDALRSLATRPPQR